MWRALPVDLASAGVWKRIVSTAGSVGSGGWEAIFWVWFALVQCVCVCVCVRVREKAGSCGDFKDAGFGKNLGLTVMTALRHDSRY